MKTFQRSSALTLLVLLAAACGSQKSAGLQQGAESPDTTLYENGMEYLGKHQHIKARLSFQTLINTYPDSDYTPSAFLGIADSYYSEAGTSNLLQAEAQYKDFLIFYPTHEMADDAQLKIAAINYRLIRPYDRDPTYARKTQAELKRFLNDHPDSDMAPAARVFLKEVEENLGRHEHEIGEFYLKRKNWDAAGSRYSGLLDDYPGFSERDVTHYRYAKVLEELGRIDEAAVQYAILAKEYPHSKFFEESKEQLILLEQPVPEIDQAAAEIHLSNVREDSFSIMDPLRAFRQVFTGRPDIYEIARKQAEQQGMALDPPPPPAKNSDNGSSVKKPEGGPNN